MKTLQFKQTALLILSIVIISFAGTGCSKSSDNPGNSIPGIHDYGTHTIDARMKGEWMWTSGSDIGYYDENGTWEGSGYGFAYRMNIDAKGNGTLYSHIFANATGYFGVDIYYTGYYETDNAGNLTFYSMGGQYVTSDGTDRALAGDEIYNASTGKGRTVSFPAIQFKTINNKECFTTTSSGVEDIFWKQ